MGGGIRVGTLSRGVQARFARVVDCTFIITTSPKVPCQFGQCVRLQRL
jgi:hypothetical protein